MGCFLRSGRVNGIRGMKKAAERNSRVVWDNESKKQPSKVRLKPH